MESCCCNAILRKDTAIACYIVCPRSLDSLSGADTIDIVVDGLDKAGSVEKITMLKLNGTTLVDSNAGRLESFQNVLNFFLQTCHLNGGRLHVVLVDLNTGLIETIGRLGIDAYTSAGITELDLVFRLLERAELSLGFLAETVDQREFCTIEVSTCRVDSEVELTDVQSFLVVFSRLIKKGTAVISVNFRTEQVESCLRNTLDSFYIITIISH